MIRAKKLLRVGYAVIFRLYGAIAIVAVATAMTLALAPLLRRSRLVGTNYAIIVWFLSLCLTLAIVFLVVLAIRKALNIMRKS
jgi:predicted PurR-regulated permease PerM